MPSYLYVTMSLPTVKRERALFYGEWQVFDDIFHVGNTLF